MSACLLVQSFCCLLRFDILFQHVYWFNHAAACGDAVHAVWSTIMLGLYMLASEIVMIYIPRLIMKLPTYSTIQTPYCRPFPELTMTGFANALRPEKIISVDFKRWQVKAML